METVTNKDDEPLPLWRQLPISAGGPVIQQVNSDEEAKLVRWEEGGIGEREAEEVTRNSSEDAQTMADVVEGDGIAKVVEAVLDDMERHTFSELQVLAEEGLQNARKAKVYRDELLFASLVDFYWFARRQVRIHASLRVSKNLGCGPSFAHMLNCNARHFEANGRLKPHNQGKRSSGQAESALDDEAFSLGVKSRLRGLQIGTVSAAPHLLPLLTQWADYTVSSPTPCQRDLFPFTKSEAQEYLCLPVQMVALSPQISQEDARKGGLLGWPRASRCQKGPTELL